MLEIKSCTFYTCLILCLFLMFHSRLWKLESFHFEWKGAIFQVKWRIAATQVRLENIFKIDCHLWILLMLLLVTFLLTFIFPPHSNSLLLKIVLRSIFLFGFKKVRDVNTGFPWYSRGFFRKYYKPQIPKPILKVCTGSSVFYPVH